MMRLKDAIRIAKRIELKGEEAIAVHVLAQLAARVQRMQKPLRDLDRALNPDTHLNQESLAD